MKTTYKVTNHPITCDITWIIDDIDLAITDSGNYLMSKFISKNRYQDYSLSIFDILTEKTIEIDCEIDKMPRIVSYIYNLEDAVPLSFIGINSSSKSYVVGMSLANGLINFGHYKDVDGRLVKL